MYQFVREHSISCSEKLCLYVRLKKNIKQYTMNEKVMESNGMFMYFKKFRQ